MLTKFERKNENGSLYVQISLSFSRPDNERMMGELVYNTMSADVLERGPRGAKRFQISFISFIGNVPQIRLDGPTLEYSWLSIFYSHFFIVKSFVCCFVSISPSHRHHIQLLHWTLVHLSFPMVVPKYFFRESYHACMYCTYSRRGIQRKIHELQNHMYMCMYITCRHWCRH